MGVIAEELKIRARWDGQDLETGVKRVDKGIDSTRDSVANLNRVLRTTGQLFGLAFGVETIRRLGAYAQESVVLGAKLDSTSQAFERMAVKAGKNAAGELQRLREYTKGTISDLELLQRVGAAVDSGLTFEQSATAVRFLRAYSTAFGKDFNQLMSTVFTGLQRGSTLMLDDAGIIISQTDKMFDGMSELEKKSALVGEAIRKMSEKLPDLETNGINAAEAADQLATNWSNLRAEIGQTLAPISQFATTLLNDVLNGFTYNTVQMDKFRKQLKLSKQEATGDRGRVLEDISRNGWSLQEKDALNRAGDAGSEEWFRAKERIIQARILEMQLLDKHVDEFKKNGQQAEIVTDRMVERVLNGAKALDVFWEAGFKTKKAWDELASRAKDAQMWKDIDVQGAFRGLGDEGAGILSSLPDVSQYVDFLDQIKMAEAQARGDRIQIIEAEHQIRVRKATEAALAIGATESQLAAFIAALEQQKTRATNEEEENRTRKAETEAEKRKREAEQKARELKQEEIRRVLLVFDADASQVKDAGDLAAYSLGLLTNQLRNLDPAIAASINSIQQIVVGAQTGGFAGAASIIGGGLGMVTGIIGGIQARVEAWKRQMEELNKRLEDARDISGQFARSLEDLNISQMKQTFGDKVQELFQGTWVDDLDLGRFANTFDWTVDVEAAMRELDTLTGLGAGGVGRAIAAEQAVARTTIEELARLSEGIRRFEGDVFDFSQALDQYSHLVNLNAMDDPTEKLALMQSLLSGIVDISQGLDSDLSDLGLRDRRRILEMIADLERSKAEVEIEAREEQAQTIIASIQRQQTEVQRVLDDQMEAQRQATLRSVKLRYDFVEAELRQKYLPLLSGAGGDTAQRALVMGDLEREIEILRESERAYGEDQLALLREKFDAQRELEDRTTELLIEAVQNASKQSDVALETAIQQQTSALMAQWVDSLDNTVLGKPVLPSELIDLRTQVLLEMSSIVNPVGVRAIDLASALEPIGVHPVDLLSALELQGVKFVNVQELLQPVGIRLVDLSQALGLTGEQVVDLAEALRLAGQIEVLVPDHFTPTGQQTINVVDFYSLTGHVDVPMSTAINPVGARIIPLDAALSPAGTRTVDLSGALSPMGERGVDLSHALRPEGQRVVDLAEALRLTGSFNVPADQVLQMTGISSQMAAQISVLDEIRLYTWATQYHLGTAVLSGGFSGGGSVVNNMVDLSETNSILREIAALNASMLSLQFAQRSVLADIDIGAIGGFQGFLQMADLIGRNLPNFDGGGVVPGPLGAPMLAVVHGQETVYPPGQGPQQAVKQVIEVRVEFSGPVVEVRAQGGSVNYRDIQRQIIQDLNDGKLRKEVGDMISSAINSAIRKAG